MKISTSTHNHHHFKKVLLFLFVMLIFLTGCEKDLYENTIVSKGKTNFVTIESVPFLMPHISDYQSKYTNKLGAKNKNEDLNLNLSQILEYVKDDGVKSYSIEILNSIQPSDKMYFENLHVAEYNGSYETFILRWTPNDTSKELQTNTFTGEVACFDIYYNLKTTMQFVDGKIISSVPAANKNITGKKKEMIGNCFYEYISCSCKGELVGAHTCDIGIYIHCSGGGGGGSTTGGSGSTNTGSTTGGGSTGPSGGGGGSGSGSSSGSTTTPPIVVVPNFGTYQNNFIKSLGNVKANFYALHPVTQNIIFDYLIYTEYQPEPSLAVKEALLKVDLEWLKNQSLVDQINIADYLSNNDFSATAATLIAKIKKQIVQNPTLKIDIITSIKSPFNIDLSSIPNDLTKPENKKFNEVYDALTQSPEFQKLFIDIFGGTQTRFNVKFEIADRVYDSKNKEVNATTSPPDPITKNIIIKISKQILIAGTTKSQTKIENAKTILHECIHAYLMIKLANPTVGMDIAGIINKMYPTINEQHDFMYTKMIPTMQKVLGEIRDLVTEKGNRDYFENFTLHPTTTPLTTVNWDWKDYFYYLSLNGLEEANCFKTDFPEKSYEYKLFTTYISNGNKYLNK